MNEDLLETLRNAQRFGFLGDRPIEEAAEHSVAYVEAIGALDASVRLVDLGSGGGLPGLVLADRYPHVSITLIDRRQKRTDFLRRAVVRLGLDQVQVIDADVDALVRDVRVGTALPFDVVTARGFGPPDVTLRFGVELLGDGGRIVISEPPSGDRWDPTLLAELGLERAEHHQVSVFRRQVPSPSD